MTSILSSVKADIMESLSIPAGTTCLFGVTAPLDVTQFMLANLNFV